MHTALKHNLVATWETRLLHYYSSSLGSSMNAIGQYTFDLSHEIQYASPKENRKRNIGFYIAPLCGIDVNGKWDTLDFPVVIIKTSHCKEDETEIKMFLPLKVSYMIPSNLFILNTKTHIRFHTWIFPKNLCNLHVHVFFKLAQHKFTTTYITQCTGGCTRMSYSAEGKTQKRF